jgi:hypothetical protein
MTEQSATDSIAPLFDQFFDQIKTVHPKIDPELLIKVMLFEKNLKEYVGPDLPHVHLDVAYEKGVDLKQKQEEGRDKFPIEVTTNKWGDGVIYSGLMGIRHIEKICVDPQIVKVTGKATPRHN